MQKIILTVIIMSFSNLLLANEGDTLGHQFKKKFVVSPNGETMWGLIRYPSTFFQTSQTYPLIVFNHGSGESDLTHSENFLSRLNRYGPGFYINTQNWNMMVMNPKTGRTSEFLYFAMQDRGFSPTTEQVMYVINNDPLLKDRIDRNGIFITGISAGGASTMDFAFLSPDIAATVAAIVPMSTWPSRNFFVDSNTAKEARIPSWSFHGLLDSTCLASSTTQPFVALMNSVGPNLARWTQLPLRHSGWNTFYSPNYRETIDGIPMSMYEWMLTKLKNSETLLATIIDSFTAKVQDAATVLDWRTSTETDNQKFIIERSEDGQNFSEVGEVSTKATNGNSTQALNYQFIYKFN